MHRDSMQLWIGYLLFGIMSIAIIILVMALLLVVFHGISPAIDFTHFQPQAIGGFRNIVSGLTQLDPSSLMRFALILVVATQSIRIFLFAIYFLIKKEHWLMLFSLFILGVLLQSVL